MTHNTSKKGTRCYVFNCDVYSGNDTFPHHRYPTKEER